MKPSAQTLRSMYQSIYPTDGSWPNNPEARRYRENEDARAQLMFSMLIQLAESVARIERDLGMVAIEVHQRMAPTAEQAAPQADAPAVDGETAEDVEMMPATQAVAGRPLPTPRVPTAAPMRAATVPAPGTGEVTMTPFSPAAVKPAQPAS